MKQIIIAGVAFTLTSFLFLFLLSFRTIETLQGINDRINRANVEYQFVIEDSATITVWDNNRFVGKARLEGQLDSLLVKDNE